MSHDDRAAEWVEFYDDDLEVQWAGADHHYPPAGDVVMTVLSSSLGVEGARKKAGELFDALSAAGLAVVQVGEPPPWMADVMAERDHLRKAMAYEAQVVEAQTDLAAIKGQRRQILDEQIKRMRLEALGKPQIRGGRWEKALGALYRNDR